MGRDLIILMSDEVLKTRYVYQLGQESSVFNKNVTSRRRNLDVVSFSELDKEEADFKPGTNERKEKKLFLYSICNFQGRFGYLKTTWRSIGFH